MGKVLLIDRGARCLAVAAEASGRAVTFPSLDGTVAGG